MTIVLVVAGVLVALGLGLPFLRGTRHPDCACDGRVFAGVDLSHADLRGEELRGADFRNARLVNADFADADLRGADFRGADVTGARMRGALLAGARGVDLARVQL